MKEILSELAMKAVVGGSMPDPVSGYDYQAILDFEAHLCGDWVYEEFKQSGAAGLKQKMKEKFGNLWFVEKFPILDRNGKVIG